MPFNIRPYSDASNGVSTPYAPAAPTPTLPPGYITAGSSPVFNPGPSLGAIDIGKLFAGAGGGAGAGAPITTHTQTGSTAPPAFAPPEFPGGTPSADLPQPPAGFGAGNDPNVLSSLGLEQQGLGQLDAALKSARERAIIGFGDPALAGEAGFGLDPQAGAFARQNYLSGNATLARLDKSHNLARQAVINRLVSHGILQSGDLGYGEGQEDQSYGNQVYDAKQQLLDYLGNLFSSYQDKQTALHQATIDARLKALNAFTQNPDAYAQFFGGD